MNSSAVARLTAMPTAATAITTLPSVAAGCASRNTASHAIAPVTSVSSVALASAARIDVPRSPYVKRELDARLTSTLASHASSRPSTSLRLWPASASSASESMRRP